MQRHAGPTRTLAPRDRPRAPVPAEQPDRPHDARPAGGSPRRRGGGWDRPEPLPRRSFPLRQAVAAIASVLLVAGGLWIARMPARSGIPVETDATPTGDSLAAASLWRGNGVEFGPRRPSLPSAGGTWAVLPEAPIDPREDAAAVWTGTELLIWGGRSPDGTVHAAGAAYRPADPDRCGQPVDALVRDGAAAPSCTGTWRALPTAPVAGRTGAAAVWTGTELLVWGGADAEGRLLADGAALDPVTGLWRVLPPSPLSARRQPIAAWTGSEFLVVAGNGEQGADEPGAGEQGADEPGAVEQGRLFDAAAYDPAAGTWRALPPLPPVLLPDPTAAWAPEVATLYVWQGRSGVAYTAGQDAWVPLPPPPEGGVGRGTMAWTGQELLILGTRIAGRRDHAGLAFTPATQTWRVLDEAPLPTSLAHAAVWDGTELLVWGGLVGTPQPGGGLPADGAVYDPATGDWRSIPAAPVPGRMDPVAVWTGSALVVWGGSGGADRPAEGAAYTPLVPGTADL